MLCPEPGSERTQPRSYVMSYVARVYHEEPEPSRHQRLCRRISHAAIMTLCPVRRPTVRMVGGRTACFVLTSQSLVRLPTPIGGADDDRPGHHGACRRSRCYSERVTVGVSHTGQVVNRNMTRNGHSDVLL